MNRFTGEAACVGCSRYTRHEACSFNAISDRRDASGGNIVPNMILLARWCLAASRIRTHHPLIDADIGQFVDKVASTSAKRHRHSRLGTRSGRAILVVGAS